MRYDVGRFRRPMRRSTEGQLASLVSLGDGSTLTLDFTTGILDPRLSFTRLSTATFINSSGIVTSVGNNIPRFDHDPTTLAPRGLLIEGQATNLLNWSESFATTGGTNNNWGYTDISDVGGKADPANGTTAIELEALNANATLISSAAIGTSAARTFSVWLRRVSGTGNIQYTQNNGTNWTTQAITSTWTRYSFTHTVDHQVGIRIVTSGDKIEIWGAQLEAGVASSYIPTGASQVTRAADSCVMTGTDFSSWFSAGSSYSMLFKYSLNSPSAFAGAGVDRACGVVSVSGGGNRTWMYAAYRTTSGSGNEGRFVRVFDSGTLDIIPATLPAAASNTSLAFAVNTNDAAISAANQSLGTDSTCTIQTGQNQIEIGKIGSSHYINGCIGLIKYWPTRLPDATLQSLTT
jgi:hypothetical protein